MNYSGEFIELNKEIHDRASFDCGEVELNEFFQKYAAKHLEAGISTTMVLPDAKPLPDGKYPVCAFYTIAPGAIARNTLPQSRKKKLPYYPVPVLLIAQMAVHSSLQGQGLGKVTLIRALHYLWNINQSMRAYAITVDCLNKNIERFYAQYGFEILEYDSKGRARMFLPMQTVIMLFQDSE